MSAYVGPVRRRRAGGCQWRSSAYLTFDSPADLLPILKATGPLYIAVDEAGVLFTAITPQQREVAIAAGAIAGKESHRG